MIGYPVLGRTAAVVLLAVLAVAALPAPFTHAAGGSATCRIRNVTQDTRDYSFRRVVAAAEDGDRLRVRGSCVSKGVVIDTDLVIIGVGHVPTLSGGGRDRVLEVGPEATLTLEHLTIRDGAAPSGGGIRSAGTLTLTDVRVLHNRAGRPDRCGRSPDPTCLYRRNTSNAGGGILNEGILTMVATRVRHNRTGVGGGIVNRGRMTISRSTIARNVAAVWGESWGGGIVNAGSLAIRRSTIARNTVVSGESYAAGGGIFNGGRLTARESTISQNRARGNNGGEGGGIANGFEYGCCGIGDVLLEATTVTGNEAGGISQCDYCGSGGMTIRASIVAGNGHDCTGHLTSAGHNLIGAAGPSCRGFEHGVQHDRVGTRAHPIDPRLERLAFNGGSTATHALRPGSSAVDAAGAGPCATGQDQRGIRRPQGRRCDIGAYERR